MSNTTPLQIEKLLPNTILIPLKVTLKRVTHNPNSQVLENYSIIEYLAQTPYAMSTLEVLQSYPTQ